MCACVCVSQSLAESSKLIFYLSPTRSHSIVTKVEARDINPMDSIWICDFYYFGNGNDNCSVVEHMTLILAVAGSNPTVSFCVLRQLPHGCAFFYKLIEANVNCHSENMFCKQDELIVHSQLITEAKDAPKILHDNVKFHRDWQLRNWVII